RAVGAAPLVAEINGRAKLQALGGELFVKLANELFEQAAAYLQSNLGDALRQKRVPFAFPVGGSFFHGWRRGQAPYPRLQKKAPRHCAGLSPGLGDVNVTPTPRGWRFPARIPGRVPRCRPKKPASARSCHRAI